mmetsp:Transcript_5394/g.14836  ORF Transcript_5394/g.14836 Transcript_5394/m.14836 type:complete len:88 (-) Transcript_5394:440-703(-)
MPEGLGWAVLELIGFLILIFFARLASIHEKAHLRNAEMQGLVDDHDVEAGSASFSIDDNPSDNLHRDYDAHAIPRSRSHTDPLAIDE